MKLFCHIRIGCGEFEHGTNAVLEGIFIDVKGGSVVPGSSA